MILRENQIKYGQTREVNFITILLKKWLKDNDIEMFSTRNDGKSVVAETFIRTLKMKFISTQLQNQKISILMNQMIQ